MTKIAANVNYTQGLNLSDLREAMNRIPQIPRIRKQDKMATVSIKKEMTQEGFTIARADKGNTVVVIKYQKHFLGKMGHFEPVIQVILTNFG